MKARKLLFLSMVISTTFLFGQKEKVLVNDILKKYSDQSGVPGIAVGIITVDSIFHAVRGVKRMGSSDPIDLNAKFQLASNTKAITSTIAAWLVSQNKISWDDKMMEIIPELSQSAHWNYSEVTLKDLLSHRSGMAAFEDEGSSEWRKMPKSIFNSDDQKMGFINYATTITPLEVNDTIHKYSNAGYVGAALMMERKTSTSWEDLVLNFFSELSLDYFMDFPLKESEMSTTGHKKRGGKFIPIEASRETELGSFFSPAGNFSMSIQDFSRFIQLHLQGLSGQDNFLDSEEYTQIHYGLDGYSLGWYNGYIGDTSQRFSYHGGSLGTFSSAVLLSAEREIAIVILINADGKEVTQMKNDLRQELWDTFK